MDEPRNPFDWQLVRYFVKIIQTVFTGLFWMMFNVFFGLYLGYGDPDESTPLGLALFYTWFGLSLAGYLYFVWRLWRRKMPPP
ncbi:hypothetical protein ACWKWU_08135 [Chitinophaga lutea]